MPAGSSKTAQNRLATPDSLAHVAGEASSWDLDSGAVGVLPAQWIEKAIASGVIAAPQRDPIPTRNVQPASLDLRLGTKAYRIRASFLPDRETVKAKLGDYVLEEFDLTGGHVLEPNCPYLIPIVERLALPSFVKAKANPKSSTGRLDIFTRVITDRGHVFDEIASGYNGPLYLEVVSRTFTVRAHAGLSLNQLRLVVGRPHVQEDEVPRDRILFKDDVTVPGKRVSTDDSGVYLSLDLVGDADGIVGLRARRNSRLLDLSLTDHYDARATSGIPWSASMTPPASYSNRRSSISCSRRNQCGSPPTAPPR